MSVHRLNSESIAKCCLAALENKNGDNCGGIDDDFAFICIVGKRK